MIALGFLVFLFGLGIVAAVIDYINFDDMIAEYDRKYRNEILMGWIKE